MYDGTEVHRPFTVPLLLSPPLASSPRLLLTPPPHASSSLQLASLVLACTRCCLWCFEQCLKFITSYAFIFVALNGDSFCVACKDTFSLLTTFPASAVLITLVQGEKTPPSSS